MPAGGLPTIVWLPAARIAALGLPGLPRSKKRIIELAEREGWRRRPRRGKGGGWDYDSTSWPAEAQMAFVARQAPANDSAASVDPQVQQMWADFERLPGGLQERARERAAAMRSLKALIDQNCRKMDAYRMVSEAAGYPVRTLERWWALVAEREPETWPVILAPKYGGRKANSDYEREAFEVFKSDYLRPGEPAAEACYQRLRRRARQEGWKIPSLGVLRRRLDREIPAPVQTLARKGRDALKSCYPPQERDRSVFQALQAVGSDGHRCNTFVRWPDRSVSRPILIAWHDLYSGKILAWRLAQSEDSNSVRLAFGDLIETWGIPEQVYLDNGRAFAAKQLSGGSKTRYRFKIKSDDPRGLFVELGIMERWAEPGAGQSKPIERWFGEFDEYVGKHPACQGAYTGKNPTAKPADYGRRAIPVADYERVVAAEIQAMNARRGRRSRVCAGRSFDETFMESFQRFPVRRASEAQRRLFLLQAEGVTTERKTGEIRLAGNRYWCPELADLPRTKVVLRFDPEKLHAPVHVYGLDGRYLCQAEVIEAAGFDDMAAAKSHARERNRFKRAQRQMLEAERRLTAADVARMLPDAEPAPAAAPKVVRPLFEAPREGPAYDQDETDEIFGRAVKAMTGGE